MTARGLLSRRSAALGAGLLGLALADRDAAFAMATKVVASIVAAAGATPA